jgi:murein L,D-transpeptidase YafK
VSSFNPWSDWHLSMKVSYPNASDRVLGETPLGGDIMIHGSCVTIGCIPIENGPIEEVYLAVHDTLEDARARGRAKSAVQVHVFPARLDDAGLARLDSAAGGDEALLRFWRGLAPGYRAFEETRRVPIVDVDPRTGVYLVRPPPRTGASPLR